ncbi:MAG: hypothetical protein ACLQVW_31285 [Limisphaerales bacterium]
MDQVTSPHVIDDLRVYLEQMSCGGGSLLDLIEGFVHVFAKSEGQTV